MDQRQQERIDGPASPAPRESWIKPEVDRLVAGGAEGTDGADTDGADLLS